MVSSRDLSHHQVDPVLAELPADWKPKILSSTEIEAIGIRGPNNLEILASGVPPNTGNPRQMYGHDVVAGVTVLRQELKPNRAKGEDEVNADHYVLTKFGDSDFRRYGPYRKQKTMPQNAGIGHWPTVDEFFEFIDVENQQPPGET